VLISIKISSYMLMGSLFAPNELFSVMKSLVYCEKKLFSSKKYGIFYYIFILEGHNE
jgi:predicted metalloprotease with PDZ domain